MEEVIGVYECVVTVINDALERLKRARAKLLDIISKSDVHGLGEVIGDINKAISDLEELL
jgi:lipoate synthase